MLFLAVGRKNESKISEEYLLVNKAKKVEIHNICIRLILESLNVKSFPENPDNVSVETSHYKFKIPPYIKSGNMEFKVVGWNSSNRMPSIICVHLQLFTFFFRI